MTLSEINKQISELKKIRDILLIPIVNEQHFIFRAYIETESLERTRKLVTEANIRKEDGNKYQVNDISAFISKECACVDKDTQEVARTILRRNSIKR